MAKEKGYKWELQIHFLDAEAMMRFRPVSDKDEFLFDRVLPVPMAIQVAEKAEPGTLTEWIQVAHGTDELIGRNATIKVADFSVLDIKFNTKNGYNADSSFLELLSIHHPICQIYLTVTPPAGTKDKKNSGSFATSFYGLPHPVFEIEETITMIIDEVGDDALDEVQTIYADYISIHSNFWRRAVERGLYRRLRVQFRERLEKVCSRMGLPILEQHLVKLGKWDSLEEVINQGRPLEHLIFKPYLTTKKLGS